MEFEMVDTETRIRRRLSVADGLSSMVHSMSYGASSGQGVGGGIGFATIPDPPPRLPSPPPLPSLEHLAQAAGAGGREDEYRSPTYSMYGVYREGDGERKSFAGASGGMDKGASRRSIYATHS
jgi:hypothetical protein